MRKSREATVKFFYGKTPKEANEKATEYLLTGKYVVMTVDSYRYKDPYRNNKWTYAVGLGVECEVKL